MPPSVTMNGGRRASARLCYDARVDKTRVNVSTRLSMRSVVLRVGVVRSLRAMALKRPKYL